MMLSMGGLMRDVYKDIKGVTDLTIPDKKSNFDSDISNWDVSSEAKVEWNTQ